jgi:NAD+ kinase
MSPPCPAPKRLRAVLLSSGQRAQFLSEVARVRPLIGEHAEIVAEDFSGQNDISGIDADLAIVFGGDGSILRAAHQMGQRQMPVIAVNLGKLGFLADVSPDELPRILCDLSAGKLQIIEHLMLDCCVIRGGEAKFRQMGLNEVAVRTGPPFLLMNIHLYVDSELVTTYSGDGLIVSTPVGSTAYSLSAGGRVYEMEVVEPHVETSAVVDGRVMCRLQAEDRVRVTRAPVRFKLVVPPGHGYYRTLREKLHWGGQFRQRNG